VYELHHGDCREVLPTIPAGSIEFVFTDPVYPCIKRSYGTWTEAEWFALMRQVVPECMRILKPSGSAVFVLQPNSERVGRMRTWLWEFMVWVGKEWGIVQDAWWWNCKTMPLGGACRDGLMRPSVKACVWIGAEDCYRNQDEVLWQETESNRVARMLRRANVGPSGLRRSGRISDASLKRGGVTPYNLLPMEGSGRWDSASTHGHGAGTPLALADWWLRYCCPPGGTCCDPFSGTATTGVAAVKQGKGYIGIECVPEYHETATKRLAEAESASDLALFAEAT
jgi:hypothetical protein